jgi:hypothetical protein
MEKDGSFDLVLSADKPAAASNWMKLEADSVALITRDYLIHPKQGRPTSWEIEALEAVPPPRLGDQELAQRFRAAANFLRDLTNINPLPALPELTNQIAEPYPVPAQTYGWAAGDACYAMGGFDLGEDEALVLEGRSPECVFWNMCLWNPYMQTYDYRYEQVTINGGQVEYVADGSWRIVIAAKNPGVANWVSTAGHRKGVIWFRWFLAEAEPQRPKATVVSIASLGR